jgi:hypothetical protein
MEKAANFFPIFGENRQKQSSYVTLTPSHFQFMLGKLKKIHTTKKFRKVFILNLTSTIYIELNLVV